LEASAVEIKELKHKLDHSSRYSVLSPPCEMWCSLKDKFFHSTKENTELKQEIAYLTPRLERMVVIENMIKDDLSRVEESATKFTYKLVLGLRGVSTWVSRVLLSLSLAPTITKKKQQSNLQKLTTHPIQSHPSTPREK
jgi:hypothetical protein